MTYIRHNYRQQLEHSFQLDNPIRQSWIRQAFSTVATQVVNALTRDSNSPKIWYTAGDAGQMFWHVYDPRTQTRNVYRTEQEVREWLDRRYYEATR
jgi:hypothetical protein